MLRALLLIFLILAAIGQFCFQQRLFEEAPEAVQMACAREPVRLLDEYQYDRCIQRNWKH